MVVVQEACYKSFHAETRRRGGIPDWNLRVSASPREGSAKGFLDKNPNPAENDCKQARVHTRAFYAGIMEVAGVLRGA